MVFNIIILFHLKHCSIKLQAVEMLVTMNLFISITLSWSTDRTKHTSYYFDKVPHVIIVSSKCFSFHQVSWIMKWKNNTVNSYFYTIGFSFALLDNLLLLILKIIIGIKIKHYYVIGALSSSELITRIHVSSDTLHKIFGVGLISDHDSTWVILKTKMTFEICYAVHLWRDIHFHLQSLVQSKFAQL